MKHSNMEFDTTGILVPDGSGKTYEGVIRMEIVANKRAIKKIDAIREPLLRQLRKDEDYHDSREHIAEHWAKSNLINVLNVARRELVERLEKEQHDLKRCESYKAYS